MTKQVNKNISLDWSISNYSDRLKFIEDNGLLKKAEQTKDIVLINKISTYLLRSRDLESNRKLDKSFYITDKEDKKIHREWITFSEQIENGASRGIGNPEELFELIIYGVSTAGLGVVDLENIYDNLDEKSQSKFLKYVNDISLDEYKKIDVSIYLNVKEFLDNFYNALNDVIEDGLDAQVINLLLEGKYQKEISQQLHISTRVVQGIVKRIFRNLKKVL